MNLTKNTDSDHRTAVTERLLSRRRLLTASAAAAAMAAAVAPGEDVQKSRGLVAPRSDRRILLSCKLSMIPKERKGLPLSTVNRLQLAAEAGFDGVDFDQAGEHSPLGVKLAVEESGVFVHNAINHIGISVSRAPIPPSGPPAWPTSNIVFASPMQPGAAAC